MSSSLVDLLALGIVSAIGPGQILLNILLLQSKERGVAKSTLFVFGMTATRLVQGVVFGFILLGAISASSSSGTHSAISSTLLLLVGMLMLSTALRQWHANGDPDGAQPKWMLMIDDLTPVKAFGAGALLVAASPNMWAFTLNAIAVIGDAQVGRIEATIAFLLFVLIAELLVWAPVVIRVAIPKQSASFLERMNSWMTKHSRALVIAVSLVLGLYFFIRGASQLLAIA